MSKVHVEVVYSVDMEIGDVPYSVIEAALKEDDPNFNIWELSGTPVIDAVTVASTK